MAKKKDSWWLFSEIRKSLKNGKKRGAEINSYMEKLLVGLSGSGKDLFSNITLPQTLFPAENT